MAVSMVSSASSCALCLAAVAEHFGYMVNPAGAVQKAKNYCSKCLKMKGKWLWRNGMAECWEYLLIKKEFNDEFETRSWVDLGGEGIVSDMKRNAQGRFLDVHDGSIREEDQEEVRP